MNQGYLLCGIAAKRVDDLIYTSQQRDRSHFHKVILGSIATRAISGVVFPILVALDWAFRRLQWMYESACIPLSSDAASKAYHVQQAHLCNELSRRCFFAMTTFLYGFISPDIVTQHFVPNAAAPGQVTPFGKLYTSLADQRYPTTIEEVQKIILEAKERRKKVSIVGAGMSQGKQTLPSENAHIALYMNQINRITIDGKTKTAKVGAGATWSDIQREAQEHGLAVQVMQASNIFSIGGSLSANCHGWDHRAGAVANTVLAITIINAQGNLQRLEPQDPLFRYIIGGYGGFGVIVEAEIALTENSPLREHGSEIAPQDYVRYFQGTVCQDNTIAMHLYRLSLDPDRLFETGVAVSYSKIGSGIASATLVDEPERGNRLDRVGLHLVRRFKWALRKAWDMEKKAALTEKLTTRNEAMRPPIRPLFNNSRVDAEWLQEYFVKGEDLADFLKFLAQTLQDNHVPLFNASVRFVKKDERAEMGYATKGDRFAVVLCFNQSLQPEKIEQTKKWVQRVIDYIIPREGTFYLPYQHFATNDQFRACYPKWQQVSEKKAEFDPEHLFNNGLYHDYLPPAAPTQNLPQSGSAARGLLSSLWERAKLKLSIQ